MCQDMRSFTRRVKHLCPFRCHWQECFHVFTTSWKVLMLLSTRRWMPQPFYFQRSGWRNGNLVLTGWLWVSCWGTWNGYQSTRVRSQFLWHIIFWSEPWLHHAQAPLPGSFCRPCSLSPDPSSPHVQKLLLVLLCSIPLVCLRKSLTHWVRSTFWGWHSKPLLHCLGLLLTTLLQPICSGAVFCDLSDLPAAEGDWCLVLFPLRPSAFPLWLHQIEVGGTLTLGPPCFAITLAWACSIFLASLKALRADVLFFLIPSLLWPYLNILLINHDLVIFQQSLYTYIHFFPN